MGRRIIICLVFIQLIALLLCPVAQHVHNNFHHKEEKLQPFTTISTQQKDITTPITTIPTNPITTTASETNPMNPLSTPATTASPVSSGSASWCVASQSSSKFALQIALDYACGYDGGADCSAIQPNGNCFMPDTLRNHASFAFNNYYKKNPLPTSCDFGGTAVTTSTNPSHGACQYPPTSTSSSILNTTNSIGSRIYGAGPITPSASVATKSFRGLLHLQFFVFLFLFLEKNTYPTINIIYDFTGKIWVVKSHAIKYMVFEGLNIY